MYLVLFTISVVEGNLYIFSNNAGYEFRDYNTCIALGTVAKMLFSFALHDS